ncbi:hypothetical protein HY483_01020 [Candidatus Woesearchaeota archaeon]|nr:hypothetical protein [Candidatus Woesearchaeota archaeon]
MGEKFSLWLRRLLITGNVLTTAYIMTNSVNFHELLAHDTFAQEVTSENPQDSLERRVQEKSSLPINKILEEFSFVCYNNDSRTDTLNQILSESRTPSIVFFYNDLVNNQNIVNGSKRQAIALSEIYQMNHEIIRGIAFPYSIIPSDVLQEGAYFKRVHDLTGAPSTRLYVPVSDTPTTTFSFIDTQFGSQKRITDVPVSVRDIPEYWFQTNLFQSGERTVYRFLDTFTWHELHADGRGNILDPADNNRVVGVDVNPELVNYWNSLRTEHEQSQDSSANNER